MIETWRDEFGTRALKLVTLLLIASFALIPVRCDASTAPHSIFTDPMTVDAADDKSDAESVTHHHQHHPGMNMADMTADAGNAHSSTSDELCSISLTAGTDLHSQQPVGAALDVPTTPVPPVAVGLFQLDGEPIVRASAPVLVLTGVTAPPEAPPPKFA